MLREGVTDLSDGGVQGGSRMRDHGGGKEHATIEVGEEQLGACLGTVEAENAKVFRTDLLDARMEHAARLAHRHGNTAPRRTTTGAGSSHETSLQKDGSGSSHFRSRRLGKRAF